MPNLTARTLISLLLAGASLPVSAQVTGRISGFVKDPAGAAIPSVTVTARMTEQQSTSSAKTNGEGFYDILALPPGAYEIVFEAAGFKRQVRSGIELTLGQNLRHRCAVMRQRRAIGHPQPERAAPAFLGVSPNVGPATPQDSGMVIVVSDLAGRVDRINAGRQQGQ